MLNGVETSRLSVISLAKMSLFEISRELQFVVCNHGEPHAALYAKGRRIVLQKEEEFVNALVNSLWLLNGSIFAR